mmetsp:Transcript_27728/g.61887  ORF Transcript_27728/g.61887 Transcript_27728/m.61887 type:complete len:227 (+) Transcript_27728:226-906(+)
MEAICWVWASNCSAMASPSSSISSVIPAMFWRDPSIWSWTCSARSRYSSLVGPTCVTFPPEAPPPPPSSETPRKSSACSRFVSRALFACASLEPRESIFSFHPFFASGSRISRSSFSRVFLSLSSFLDSFPHRSTVSSIASPAATSPTPATSSVSGGNAGEKLGFIFRIKTSLSPCMHLDRHDPYLCLVLAYSLLVCIEKEIDVRHCFNNNLLLNNLAGPLGPYRP